MQEYHQPAQIENNYNFQVTAQQTLEPTRDWVDYGYMMLAFIVFTVAFAIVRSIYNQTVAKIPKDNWKSQFKRRLSNVSNQSNADKNESNEDTSIVKRGLGFLSRRSSQAKAEKKPRFDPELENVRVVEHVSDDEGGAAHLKAGVQDDNDMGFETSSNESKNRGSMMNQAKNLLGIGKGSKFNPVKA